jgi:excinuclease ABC subunit A
VPAHDRARRTQPRDPRARRREHNLKNIDVSRSRAISSWSSPGSPAAARAQLAFDTIFAEGQRKYMESLSAYARQFLDQLKKPDVEEISRASRPPSPSSSAAASGNPRSTVATTTEIYDYLRLLMARCGTPTCSWAPTKTKKDGTVNWSAPGPHQRHKQHPDRRRRSWATRANDPLLGTRACSSSRPVVRGLKGFHKRCASRTSSARAGPAPASTATSSTSATLLKEGGENPLNLGRYEKHTIEAVVDRLVLGDADGVGRQRLAESVESALKLSQGQRRRLARGDRHRQQAQVDRSAPSATSSPIRTTLRSRLKN